MIFINNLSDYIEYASVIMYADDAVSYVSHESKEKIENDLNQDMQNLLSSFRENEPVINLKKGKTETMLFGTTLKTAGEIWLFCITTKELISLKPKNILEI